MIKFQSNKNFIQLKPIFSKLEKNIKDSEKELEDNEEKEFKLPKINSRSSKNMYLIKKNDQDNIIPLSTVLPKNNIINKPNIIEKQKLNLLNYPDLSDYAKINKNSILIEETRPLFQSKKQKGTKCLSFFCFN